MEQERTVLEMMDDLRKEFNLFPDDEEGFQYFLDIMFFNLIQ